MTPIRGNPLEFLNKLTSQKLEGGATVWWKFHNPNFNRFRVIHRAPADEQTDGRAIAYSALSIAMQSSAKNERQYWRSQAVMWAIWMLISIILATLLQRTTHMAIRITWSDDFSQCWTRLRVWPINCGDPTTSPTRWPASIGCASLRISSSWSPYWHSRPRICAGVPRPFHSFADLPSRLSLRSVGTNRLVVPTSRLSTVASRAFPVAGPQTWNELPEDVTAAESLATFRHLLKTHLFRKSFPDYLLDINWLSLVDIAVVPLLRPPQGRF